MSPSLDWLSRLLELMPVRGQLDLLCLYRAPWRIIEKDWPAGEIRYHVIISGSAVLEGAGNRTPKRLGPGDILVVPHSGDHTLHDGGGETALPSRSRQRLNLVVSENKGTGDRLDMLCGRFVVTAPHDRWLRDYFPSHLVVHTATDATQLTTLVSLMRTEAAADNLGGHAMLNALSTAMFALILRRAGEMTRVPSGLLALVGHPRLAPALAAMFHEPARSWALAELADLCHMSRATLARHFQVKLGHSANELLTDIRMTLAAKQLAKTSLSTGTVADSVGYQSEAAFQRAFKQHMGMTPAGWRKANPRS